MTKLATIDENGE